MKTATGRGIVPGRRALVAAAVAGVLALQGCATKKDVRTLQDTIEQMQMHQDSVLQAIQRQNRLMLDTLRSSMALTLDSRGQTSHRFEELNGMIESSKALNGQILEVSRQLLGGMNTLEQKMQVLQNAITSQPSQAGTSSGASAPSSGGMTPAQSYAAGVQRMNDGQYGSARQYFKAVIAANHDDPVAPDARYQIGETYAREESYSEAYTAFEQVAAEWPAAPRAPEALYRAGAVARDAGDNAKARKYYNSVIQLYAKSEFAKLARTALAKLPK